MVFESRRQKTTRYQPLTSLCCQIRSHDMEEKMERGRYCVAGPPNQQSCQNRSFTRGIRMYQMQLPADPAVRAKWFQFVRRHKHDLKNPTSKYTSLCPAHFEDLCYERSLSVLSSMEAAGMKVKYCLKKERNPNEGYYYSTRSRRT